MQWDQYRISLSGPKVSTTFKDKIPDLYSKIWTFSGPILELFRTLRPLKAKIWTFSGPLLHLRGDIQIREILKNEDRDFLHPQTRSPRTPPPPLRVQFCGNKINPHFFLEIESMIAKTNFTLGPIEKSIFLVQL